MLKFLILAILALANASPFNDGRIVGGQDIDIQKVPYQLSLQKNREHICGASLIARNVALTAAHCTNGVNPKSLKVMGGATNLNDPSAVYSQVAKIIQNKDYNTSNQDNDISLLILKYPMDDVVATIKLANDELKSDIDVTISGWGYEKHGGTTQEHLKQAKLKSISDSDCKKLYDGYDFTGNMICAGILSGGIDSCRGDSGGPLVANGIQYGIASWGVGCGEKDHPGVYTKVSNYITWINDNAKI